MPSLESPCLLLPHGSDRSSVYVCIPVDAEIAKRSPVIETLMEFEGLSQLPAGISLEDFATWSALQTDDPAKLGDEELVFALQVSDKLSAHDTQKLTQALAERLKNLEWARSGASGFATSALHAFLLLNSNLQQLVFRGMGSVCTLKLLSWPVELQQAYADLWVPHDRSSFRISENHTPEAAAGLLSMLSRTNPALPRLGSLEVRFPITSTATAALLCDTLTHHSSLSRLDLHRLSWSPDFPSSPAAEVLRTLPHLSALTALTLSCCVAIPPAQVSALRIDAATECIQALSAAISSLPTLASFHLYNEPPPARPTPKSTPSIAAVKRRKIAACFGPSSMHAAQLSLDPVIAALSTAPALTALAFTLTVSGATDELPCSGVLGPFSCLVRLQLNIKRAKASGDVLCTLCPTKSLLHIAPLPGLRDLTFHTTTFPDDGQCVEGVLRSAARQPALDFIRVQLGGNGPHPREFHRQPRNPQTLSNVSDAVDLSFSIAMPVPVRCMPSVAAGLAHLQRLCSTTVTVDTIDTSTVLAGDGQVNYFPDATAADLRAMLQPLGNAPRLKFLAMFGGGEEEDEVIDDVGTLAHATVSGPLPMMTQLTTLILGSAGASMPASELGQSLRALPNLESVDVSGVRFATAAELTACFGHLSAVSDLIVSTHPINGAVVKCFAEAMAELPQVEYAILDLCPVRDASGGDVESDSCVGKDWIEGLLHLPTRGHFTFNLSADGVDEEVIARIVAHLRSQGAEVEVHPFCTSVAFELEASDADSSSGNE